MADVDLLHSMPESFRQSQFSADTLGCLVLSQKIVKPFLVWFESDWWLSLQRWRHNSFQGLSSCLFRTSLALRIRNPEIMKTIACVALLALFASAVAGEFSRPLAIRPDKLSCLSPFGGRQTALTTSKSTRLSIHTRSQSSSL